MKTYSVRSLDELAEVFEMFAKNVENSPLQTTKRTKELVAMEAATWRNAAEVIRDTILEANPLPIIELNEASKKSLARALKGNVN
jgi:hypothetical protein